MSECIHCCYKNDIPKVSIEDISKQNLDFKTSKFYCELYHKETNNCFCYNLFINKRFYSIELTKPNNGFLYYIRSDNSFYSYANSYSNYGLVDKVERIYFIPQRWKLNFALISIIQLSKFRYVKRIGTKWVSISQLRFNLKENIYELLI